MCHASIIPKLDQQNHQMRSNHPFVKKKRMQVAAETGCTIKQEKKEMMIMQLIIKLGSLNLRLGYGYMILQRVVN